MPLPFASVCELLEEAHKACLARQSAKPVVDAWFARNRTTIDAHDTSLTALLSTLLPEKRTDRVYYIQSNALEKLIGRGLCLRSSRIPDLARHRQAGSGLDLADCVECALNVTPNFISPHMRVTVEEVDQLLHGLASRIKFSSPAIRASYSATAASDRGDLANIYRRLTPVEAKWLTRLVLKSFAPLVFDDNLIYRLCDPVLPSVLQVQADFSSALDVLQSARNRLLPSERGHNATRRKLLAQLKPKLGVKVGRQHWSQARSIKHCLSLGRGRMSVEDKIDGEYCQIHVNLRASKQRLQIFSKSGKDSTEDKEALHSIVLDSLDVGKSTCRFSKGCILEGEVVVYSDREKRILPFHKIRNHITRRGLFLNTDQDSLPKAGEHLMIVYYDILLLDDDSLLSVRHLERRRILSNLIRCQLGWAELAKSEVIDFGSPLAASNLRNAFAKTIVNRQEGLVLKVDEAYFDFSILDRPWTGRCIKLKKEYIGGFGDVGDFAIVGAGYDAVKARQYNLAGLKWTHFYLGCLCNKDQVERWAEMPEFHVVNVVELNQIQLRSIIQCGNPVAILEHGNNKFKINIEPGLRTNPPMSYVFTQPLVVDLRCFSFDKVGSTGFWSPRFPVVSRIHLDRDYMEALSFQELQQKAQEATKVQSQPDSQENLEWIARLEAADPRGIAVDAVSQQTATTMPTPSPRRSTQSSSQNWSLSPTVPRTLARSATQPAISPAAHLHTTPNLPSSRPLITPPTSSDPTPPSPKQKENSQTRKRSSPISSQTSKTPKRRKSTDNKQRLAESPMPKPDSQRAIKRTPLAEVDGNSSQRSGSSSQLTKPRSPSKCVMSREPEVIDLTSSPDASFSTTNSKPTTAEESPHPSQDSGNTTLGVREDSLHDAKEALAPVVAGSRESLDPASSHTTSGGEADAERREDSQPITADSQASDYVNLFMPGWDHAKDDDEYPFQSSPPARQASQHSQLDLVHDSVKLLSEGTCSSTGPKQLARVWECKHAGSMCHLSMEQVVLAPRLQRDMPSEVATLLGEHGFDYTSTHITPWSIDLNLSGHSPGDPDVEGNVVFFVDSLEHPAETEALCAQTKNLKGSTHPDAGPSVTFYDWRMLKHLTTHEDQSVVKKYYDGFSTPFRRWFIGSV